MKHILCRLGFHRWGPWRRHGWLVEHRMCRRGCRPEWQGEQFRRERDAAPKERRTPTVDNTLLPKGWREAFEREWLAEDHHAERLRRIMGKFSKEPHQ